MKAAEKSDWKSLDPPKKSAPLEYAAVFTEADFDTISQGLVPQDMEDKWFIYYQDRELFLHRSWTGALIYWVRFDGSPAGVRSVDSWVSREPDQYEETDTEYDREMLNFLIRRMLLGEDVDFPMRGEESVAGVTQHSAVGRAYPETQFSSQPLSLFQRFKAWLRSK